MRPRTKRDYKIALDDIYNAFQEHGTLGAGAFSNSPIHRDVLCELKKRGAVLFTGRTRSLKMWWNPDAIRPGNTAAESIMTTIVEYDRNKQLRRRDRNRRRKPKPLQPKKQEGDDVIPEQPPKNELNSVRDEDLFLELWRRGYRELDFHIYNDGEECEHGVYCHFTKKDDKLILQFHA